MSSLNELMEFLRTIDIDAAEKNFTFDFCKKNEYIDGLMNAVMIDTGDPVSIGYGNINGQIMLVFQDRNSLDILKPAVQESFEKIGIDLWTMYITYVDKTQNDYPKKYNVLMNELNAVKPKILYFIDNTDNHVFNLKAECAKYKVAFPRCLIITPNEIVNDKKATFAKLKYAVNFKDIFKK